MGHARIRRRAAGLGVAAAALMAAAPASAVVNQLEFDAPVANTFGGSGFTSGMTGSTIDETQIAAGGGVLTLTTSDGDAFLSFNDQLNALGIPVVDGPAGYTASTVVELPPAPAEAFQSAGVYASVDQDTYVKAVLSVRAGSPVLNVVHETNGSAPVVQNTPLTLGGATSVTLSLAVDPNGVVSPTVRVGAGAVVTPSAGCASCVDTVTEPALAGPNVEAGVIATNFDDPEAPGIAPAFSPRFSSFTLDNPNQTDAAVPQPAPGEAPGTGTTIASSVCVPGADTTAPTVAGRAPADGGISATGEVTVRFSEPVVVPRNAVRLTTSLGAAIPSRSRLAPDSLSVRIVPTAPLPTGNLFLVVSGGGDVNTVTDAACNRLATSFRAPLTVAGSSGGQVRLTQGQLRINQRVSQAAILREAAIRQRLLGNLTGADIQNGALTASVFGPGVTLSGTDAGVLAPSPAGRTLVVPEPSRSGGGRVELSAAQLRINQRISQAAVRRVNAIQSLLDAGLRGGDVTDGTLTSAKLAVGLAIASATPTAVAPAPPPAVAPPGRGGGRVELSEAQLRINQRISQAAVRRLNAIRGRLEQGLTGSDFRAQTVTAVDLASGQG
jgi:hypothetical protein